MLLIISVTNITVAFLDETFRFEFVETRDEIKDRMVNQYKASQKGFTANDVNIMGKITLAKYFIYIEVYDFSISEDETINLKDGIKNTLVTRLGMQVRAVNAETGLYMTGSGLGKATTTSLMLVPHLFTAFFAACARLEGFLISPDWMAPSSIGSTA